MAPRVHRISLLTSLFTSLLAALVLSVALWLLLAGRPARAVDDVEPDAVVERQLQHYVVEPGGAYALTVEEVRAGGGAQAIQYDAAREQVLRVEAWVLKPDGRRAPAQLSATQPAAGGTRLRTLAIGGAAAGDRLVVRYTIHGSRALFPGHFEDLVVVPPGRARNVEVIYDMPAGLPLHADAAGFAQVAAASPPGRRRYQWRYLWHDAGGNDVSVETGSVSYLDYGRRLAVSTFPDYPSFAAALRQGMAGRARPTAPVAALAREVTDGTTDAHARATLLAGWVRRNVRHVDDYPGADAVVPRDAAAVLASRRGDCKDHAVLLAALLEAVGIDSTAAVVNNGAAYRLPDVPSVGVFNHMITYVPSLGLFLDSSLDASMAASGEGIDAGQLPTALLGKPVLLVQTGTFAMTPLLQPHRQVATATVDIDLDPRFAERTPLALETTQAQGSPVRAALASMMQEQERRLDYVCPAIDAQDDTAFRLPADARVLALPASVRLMNGGIFYQASYRRAATAGGQAIVVTRRLTFRHGGPTCTPLDYRAMRPALARIEHDLRSRIIVAGR